MTTTASPLPKRRPHGHVTAATEESLRITVADATAWPMIRDWAVANAWSPGAHDGECYLAADPESLHIGYLGELPVSALFVVNHDANFAFLGGYMVPPEHRGNGYGRATFDAAMKHAGTRVVGLHAVTDQVENYKKSGFAPTYSTWRFSGDLTSVPTDPGRLIVDAGQADLAKLIDDDARHFRAARPQFVQAWLTAPGHIAKVAVDGQEITGFGVIRPTVDHARIGPLYARDTATARVLLQALASAAGSATVALDVPDPNPAACDLAAELGLRAEFEMVTMFTPGLLKPIHRAGVFAVASAELG